MLFDVVCLFVCLFVCFCVEVVIRNYEFYLSYLIIIIIIIIISKNKLLLVISTLARVMT